MNDCGMNDGIESRMVMVQGGLSSDKDPNIMEKVSGCVKAASRAYDKLLNAGSADEAVVDALWWLENDEFFNCGYGSFSNNQGIVEMDASLMNGTLLKCGSVVGLKNIEHPILIAQKVMNDFTNHIVTNEMIKTWKNLESNIWISSGTMLAETQNDEYKKKIVSSSSGCLVWDGINMSAGSTSGGRADKNPGSISEAGIIGSGIFASKSASCVITGSSDLLHKLGLAREIVEEVTEIGSCPEGLLRETLNKVSKEFNEEIGGIILQSNGCHGIFFTSCWMPYAIIQDGLITYGWKTDDKRYEKYQININYESCRCD